MRPFEDILLGTTLQEYLFLFAITTATYFLLPGDWEGLRARICFAIFFLLITVKSIVGISYLDLATDYLPLGFINIWISICAAVFYFSLQVRRSHLVQRLKKSMLAGCLVFFLLYFLKLLVI